ncbi:MAG: SGNH/GDSL hydrolase family protein [Planctomycetota bacterium]|nr:SGNH/GDSL hydrolase family protein [Planctomycetota bacterium]
MFLLVLLAGCATSDHWESDFSHPPGRDLWRLATDGHAPVGGWLLEAPGAVKNVGSGGAIEVSGGWWESPAIPVKAFNYYRVGLRARSPGQTHWGAIFFTEMGEQIIADNYHSFDASEAFADSTFIIRAPQEAAHVILRFRSPDEHPLVVNHVTVDHASSGEALAFSDALFAKLPKLKYTPPTDRWSKLPVTHARLASGDALRVVMLGDSICNDTSNSNYERTVAERWYMAQRAAGPPCGMGMSKPYPVVREPAIQIITSVRGGTGCNFYAEENRVKPYVLDHHPDLLIIAGISNGPDAEPVRNVIRQVRQASPKTEILVLTGAITPPSFLATQPRWYPESTRGRGQYNPDPEIIASIKAMPFREATRKIRVEAFSERMEAMAKEEGVAFLDMRRAWDEYMEGCGRPQEYLLRDPLHGNQRAKEIVGRILAAYLSPDATGSPPASGPSR